jgi:type IV pilus assembly protein PilV
MITTQDHPHMMQTRISPARHGGFTMIEVLVALVIIVLGLLGLAGMQVRMQQAEFESYQRTQALILLYDMVDRININRETAPCFAFTTAADGTPYLGTGGAAPPACAISNAANNANANAAMVEWDNLLKGAAETKGGNSVGAMVDARGCVAYDAASELLDSAGVVMPGTGIYTVSVAWQGTAETAAPVADCANGLYGAAGTGDRLRRAVSATFRVARLN